MVSVSEKVTVIWNDALCSAEVVDNDARPAGTRGICVGVPNTSSLAFYTLSEEGIRWIRGWHAPDSSEIRALLTAFALCP